MGKYYDYIQKIPYIVPMFIYNLAQKLDNSVQIVKISGHI